MNKKLVALLEEGSFKHAVHEFTGNTTFPVSPQTLPGIDSAKGVISSRQATILVTSVDRTIGQSVARIMQRTPNSNFQVVGVSRYTSASGRVWCNTFFSNLDIKDGTADSIADMVAIAKRYRVAIIFAGTEMDLPHLQKHRAFLERQGIKVAINSEVVLQTGLDKWACQQALTGIGVDEYLIPTVEFQGESYQDLSKTLGPDILFKPRSFSGSRGLIAVHDEESFKKAVAAAGDTPYICQKIVGEFSIMDSREYTVSIFGFGDGRFNNLIAFERYLSRDGHTQHAKTVSNPELTEVVRTISSRLKPLGPTNLQFKIVGDRFHFLEINPKISASTGMRFVFGVNEPLNCIQWFLHGQEPDESVQRQGTITRYLEDFAQFV